MIREIEIPDYPNRGITFPEHQLAHDLLDDLTGIILGESAHNHFNLPNAINVAPEAEEGYYIKSQLDMNGKFCRIDKYGEANALPFDDSSQEFIAHSHCAEHFPDLIGAFIESARVLKDEGVLFMIVPQRGARPEDANRPVTTIEEFARAYNEKWTADTLPPEVVQAAGGNRGHVSVFTLESLKEVLMCSAQGRGFQWEIIAEEETDSKVNNGHTLVAKLHKTGHWPKKGGLGDAILSIQEGIARQGFPRTYA